MDILGIDRDRFGWFSGQKHTIGGKSNFVELLNSTVWGTNFDMRGLFVLQSKLEFSTRATVIVSFPKLWKARAIQWKNHLQPLLYSALPRLNQSTVMGATGGRYSPPRIGSTVPLPWPSWTGLPFSHFSSFFLIFHPIVLQAPLLSGSTIWEGCPCWPA